MSKKRLPEAQKLARADAGKLVRACEKCKARSRVGSSGVFTTVCRIMRRLTDVDPPAADAITMGCFTEDEKAFVREFKLGRRMQHGMALLKTHSDPAGAGIAGPI